MNQLGTLDLHKYQYNSEMMVTSYINPVFGGFLVPNGQMMEVAPAQLNSLKSQIMQKEHFGFFSLFNVRASLQIMYDIHILLDKEPNEK